MNPELPRTRKSNLQVVHRRKARQDEEELGAQRADALFFRSQALAIVRHFFEIATQVGRLPSIMGREFFRAKVSHHRIPSFEEQAVFVHDVELALSRLNESDAEVIALVGLFQYSLTDVATMLGRSRSGVAARFADSLDHLAETFLEFGLLHEDRPDRRLRRVRAEAPEQTDSELPPKKPAASIHPETYHIVGEQSGECSFKVCTKEA
ncbi:MAG TPA: hypothetical protein VMT56_01850 [Candidatus Bathyarchaeia archaeon]|nr:hypothetical protein [Candidatus Bathyarchaeia archaeon]